MSLLRTRHDGGGRGERERWLDGLEQLRAATTRGDRSEWTGERLERLARWVSEWGEVISARQRALARRALADIKACVLDPARLPDPELWRALGSQRDPLLEGLMQAGDEEVDLLLESLGEDPPLVDDGAEPEDGLGTLREPLTPSTGRQEFRVLMKGDLQAGLLSDVIQMFAQNNETGRLVVQSGEGGGAVYFDTGRIVDATYGSDTGEPAFHRVMRLTRGRFSYERGVRATHTRIACSVQHLILDALRVIDEATR